MQWLGETISRLERGETVVVVAVLSTRGSAPRPTGTRMLVSPDDSVGSVGGGTLERRALARARELLAAGKGRLRQVADDLGSTALLFERMDSRDLPFLWESRSHLAGAGALTLTPLDRSEAAKQVLAWDEAPPALAAGLGDGADAAVVAHAEWGALLVERLVDRRARLWLFGAGHVGQALVKVMAPLPFHVTWVDDRPGFLPSATAGMRPQQAERPADEVANAPAGALLVTMSHSHALDFAIVEAALRRDDLGFVGMIASAAKKAKCLELCRANGLADAHLARLTAPIGVPGIGGREPAVIAVSVAAQLLQVAEAGAVAAARAAAPTPAPAEA